MRISTLLLASLLCLPGIALSGTAQAGQSGYNAHFGHMDAGGDGLVDQQEFLDFFDHGDAETFAAIDTDNSGAIDHDEWHAFKAAHGYGHGDAKGGREGHGQGKHE